MATKYKQFKEKLLIKGVFQIAKAKLNEITLSPEDLPEAMNDREKWRERVRDIHAGSTRW